MTTDAAALICCCSGGQPPGACCYCSSFLAGRSFSVAWTGSIVIAGNLSFSCFQQVYPAYQQYCMTLGNSWLNWRSGTYDASPRAVSFSTASCSFTHSTFQESSVQFDQYGLTTTCAPVSFGSEFLSMRRARYTLTPPKGACPGAPARNYWSATVELLLFQNSQSQYVSALSLEFRSPPTWSCTPPQSLAYFPTAQPLSRGCSSLGTTNLPIFPFMVAAGYSITAGAVTIA